MSINQVSHHIKSVNIWISAIFKTPVFKFRFSTKKYQIMYVCTTEHEKIEEII